MGYPEFFTSDLSKQRDSNGMVSSNAGVDSLINMFDERQKS